MNEAWRRAAVDHMLAAYPREGVGLVVRPQRKRTLVFVACENRADTPQAHFVLSAGDYADAEDRGAIVALVHSHPDEVARPSEQDKVMCEASGLIWHILRIDGRELETPEFVEWVEWVPNGYEAPLVGREFSYGTLDCYTLVRDYYMRELGITLPDFDRGPDGWWENCDSDFDPYTQHMEAAKFVEVAGPSEVGDLIIMQVRSPSNKPNHAGVYIGEGLMLHHMYGQLSTREVYGGYWATVTRKVLRRAA